MGHGEMVYRLLLLAVVLGFPTTVSAQAPTISDEPESIDVCGSDTAVTFTVTSSGQLPLYYQWSKDGVDIDGATAATYTIASPTSSDAGDYEVEVSNIMGIDTSDAATLTYAGSAPTIDTDPDDVTVCDGGSATFSVAASGDELNYQWRKQGTDLSGETGSSLTIDPVTAAEGGNYDVVVSNPCGSTTSVSVTLFVDLVPTIAAQPEDSTICVGETISLSIDASGGANLDYQWRKDGVDLVAETSSTLVITDAVVDDSANYDVVLSNPCGTLISTASVVVVAEDPDITVDVASTTTCVGDATVFTVTAESAVPLTYQWRKGGSDLSGENAATLTIASTEASDAGDYDVEVTNQCATVTSAAGTLTVADDPVIDSDIANATICVGDAITFSVSVSSIIPLTYEWRLDGTTIEGETADTLEILSADGADAGDYEVHITNDCATVVSNTATLVVADIPTIDTEPIGLTVCAGDPVSLSVAASSLIPLSYQWRFDGANMSGEDSSALTIASASASDAGDYDVVVTNDCGSVTSIAVTLFVADVPVINTDIGDQTICVGDELAFTISATSLLAQTYQWRHSGANIDGATDDTLTVDSVTLADAGAYDVLITNTCGTTTSTQATVLIAEIPVVTTAPVSQTVCVGDPLALSVEATSVIPLSYQWRFNGINVDGETSDTLTIDSLIAADGGDYDVVVTNDCGSVTSAAAILTVPDVPFIDTAPEETAVCIGDDASFTIAVSSLVPFTYQWRFGGVDIDGETSDTLTVLAADLDDAGSYDVVLSNMCGETISVAVELIVGDVPVIETHPVAVEAQSKDTVTLTVEVSSAVPLSYQWHRDGDALEGKTDASLVIDSVALADVGSYSVDVTSQCGMVTSQSASINLPEFRRGDTNRDDLVNVADLVFGISYLFNDGVTPGCMDAADINDDGMVDVADIIYEIRYLFLGFAEPPAPGPTDCGPDTEEDIDDLNCLVEAESCE